MPREANIQARVSVNARSVHDIRQMTDVAQITQLYIQFDAARQIPPRAQTELVTWRRTGEKGAAIQVITVRLHLQVDVCVGRDEPPRSERCIGELRLDTL